MENERSAAAPNPWASPGPVNSSSRGRARVINGQIVYGDEAGRPGSQSDARSSRQAVRPGLFVRLCAFLFALVDFIRLFFKTIFSPNYPNQGRRNRQMGGVASLTPGGGRPDGGGGSGSRPRFSNFVCGGGG
ncbi:putative transmembrane protein [Toxoplasma gondii RUB]|uniref:Putative transmembrane protein n=1 Tax=Toxoplasma gondii RUB TaxID=935652 RepID=A0A086MC44_TOXGO|nr:putative transmembrane protein [Toxoplasma gondii RUB]